jgi:ribosomal protein S13
MQVMFLMIKEETINKMTKELNENSGFKISIKTLIGIGAAMATIISMWFMLQADIADAKELPKADVSRMEFDMKDQLIRQTIMTTQDDVTEIKEDIKLIKEKLYE